MVDSGRDCRLAGELVTYPQVLVNARGEKRPRRRAGGQGDHDAVEKRLTGADGCDPLSARRCSACDRGQDQ
jgi:hypothetical protein